MWLNPKSNLPAAVGHLLVNITHSVKKCFVTLKSSGLPLIITSDLLCNAECDLLPLYYRMFLFLGFTSWFSWCLAGISVLYKHLIPPASEQIYVLFTTMFYYNTFCYIVVKYFDSFTLSCLFVEQSGLDLSMNKHALANPNAYKGLQEPWKHSYRTNMEVFFTWHHRIFGLKY